MSIKKRILASFTAAILLLSGCSNSGTSSPSGNSSSQSDTKEQLVDFSNLPELPKFAGTAPADSDLYVAPVKGLSDDFVRGADVSSYLSEIESGVVYKDYEGNELDKEGFFKFLAENGVSCIRIRVWNDPKGEDGKTYGGGHNDLDTAIEIGKLATSAGLGVMIDFHYSDFWADPTRQTAPKAWANATLEEKNQLLYDYTVDSLNAILDAGINVTYVQIGNEINNGLAGEKGRSINELLKKGSEAVRTVSAARKPDIKVVVHYTEALTDKIFEACDSLKEDNVDYDILGLSFYTFWHGSAADLTERIKTVRKTYGIDVMVVETSYVYTDKDGDGQGNSVTEPSAIVSLDYQVSVQGQANEFRAIVNSVNEAGGTGVFYWEPAWIPVGPYSVDSENAAQQYESNFAIWEEHGSGWATKASAAYDPEVKTYYGGSSWDNQAMFDFEGNPLESLKIFKYIYNGTTASVKIEKVNNTSIQSGIGQPLSLPEKVLAVTTDDETKEISVTWKDEDINSVDVNVAGTYEIGGTASADGKDYEVKCSVEILKINYVKNFGFEDEDMSAWTISGNGVDRTGDNNIHDGAYCLKFWDDKQVTFTAEQTLANIPAGTYEAGTFLQGGDAGAGSVFEFYVSVNGETQTVSSSVSGWLNWDEPKVTNIVVPEGAEIKIGVKVDATAGTWGAFDDFYFQLAD